MEKKRILELVRIELNTFNRESSTWGSNSWTDDLDLILRKMNTLGDLYKINGGYYGTVQTLHYEPLEEKHAGFRRFSLTFEEFDEMGRPRKIQETITYAPLEEDS